MPIPTLLMVARSGRRLSLTLALAALLPLGAAGCTHLPPDGTPDMTGTPADLTVPTHDLAMTTHDLAMPPLPDMAMMTPADRGKIVVAMFHCGACHNPENMADGVLSGQMMPRMGTMAYGANLTPDKDTGIGDWTDAEITRAVRTGIDDGGAALCPPMPKFSAMTMSDAQLSDLIAYLRSIPAVSRAIPQSMCAMPMDGGTPDAH